MNVIAGYFGLFRCIVAPLYLGVYQVISGLFRVISGYFCVFWVISVYCRTGLILRSTTTSGLGLGLGVMISVMVRAGLGLRPVTLRTSDQ